MGARRLTAWSSSVKLTTPCSTDHVSCVSRLPSIVYDVCWRDSTLVRRSAIDDPDPKDKAGRARPAMGVESSGAGSGSGSGCGSGSGSGSGSGFSRGARACTGPDAGPGDSSESLLDTSTALSCSGCSAAGRGATLEAALASAAPLPAARAPSAGGTPSPNADGGRPLIRVLAEARGSRGVLAWSCRRGCERTS